MVDLLGRSSCQGRGVGGKSGSSSSRRERVACRAETVYKQAAGRAELDSRHGLNLVRRVFGVALCVVLLHLKANSIFLTLF